MNPVSSEIRSTSNISIHSEEWLNELLDSQLGSVIIYQPVMRNESDRSPARDFDIIYCNQGSEKLTCLYHELFIYENLGCLSTLTFNDPASLYQQLVNVWETGIKMQNTFYHPGTG